MHHPGFVLLTLFFVLLFSPAAVRACPMCSEAVPSTSGTEEDDQVRLSRGYNNSIYLMAGMPYFLLGTMGYLIYRQVRLRDGGQPLTPDGASPLPPAEDDQPVLPGDRACSLPRDGDS